ncbi:MAG: DUF5666 domain-containing protein [Janthinobacterium lividum]
MRRPTLLIATALSTVALAGAIGVGVASADPVPSPTPSATASPTAGAPTAKPSTASKPGKPATAAKTKRALTKRALHGEVALAGEKHRVVDFQRGTVSAVSASSITVRSTDDFSATYVVDASTKVRQAKEKTTIADVKTGDEVRVVATKSGATRTANRIGDRTR